MNLKMTALACSVLGLAACATTAPTPIKGATINQFKLSAVDVDFSETRSIPEVYDNAVKALIDGDGYQNSVGVVNFQKYVDANGGAGNDGDQLAERYLEYRIEEEIKSALKTSLNGPTPVDIVIKIDKVQTPNAATMLLVGEIKSIRYDLDVIKSGTNNIMIDLSEPSTPFVERSAGAGGGLLGLALRSGTDTNLSDLEQLASAVSVEVSQIMLGPVVNKTVLDKIRVAGVAP